MNRLNITHKFSPMTKFWWLAVIALLNGCAHQNLFNDGQQLMTQQRAELALEKFQAAQRERPDDERTALAIKQAQTALSQWSDKLYTSAQQAQQSQQDAKALLLYAKVFQLTKNDDANRQYKYLYNKLRKQSVIKVNLTSHSAGIDGATIESVDGLVLDTSPQALPLKFAQSNPIFEIQQSSQIHQTQYISGTQLVANPELVDLQHALSRNQHRYRDVQREIKHQRRSSFQLDGKLSQEQRNKQTIEAQLLVSNLSPDKRAKLDHSLQQAQSSINRLENKLRSSNNELRDLRQDAREYSHQTNELAHQLAHTPATAEVPIYANYEYRVEQQVNSLTATLYMTINGQVRPANITAESKDQSHPAHPTINLAANPMVVDGKPALMPVLDNQRVPVARRLLSEFIDETKLGYFYQAQQAIDIDDKFSLLIKHGLITQQGATIDATIKIKQRLILEFGQVGEFNVNELLHIYK